MASMFYISLVFLILSQSLIGALGYGPVPTFPEPPNFVTLAPLRTSDANATNTTNTSADANVDLALAGTGVISAGVGLACVTVIACGPAVIIGAGVIGVTALIGTQLTDGGSGVFDVIGDTVKGVIYAFQWTLVILSWFASYLLYPDIPVFIRVLTVTPFMSVVFLKVIQVIRGGGGGE